MGTAYRLLGLTLVMALGCAFDSGNANDSSQLGSSAGESNATSGPTSDASTGEDTAGSGGADGETSVGGSTSVGSEESCVDVCVPQVPAGWQGPYYVADVSNPIDCPEGYAAADLAFSGLSAPEASCDCSCTPSGEGSCAVNFLMSINTCPAGLTIQVGDGGCEPLVAELVDVHTRAEMTGTPATCTPNVVQTVDEPSWETTNTFCAAPARGGDCGDDRCTIPPPEGLATRLCIAKNGENGCPSAEYDRRRVLYRDYEDKRTCEGCNCAGPQSCTGQAFAHDNASCNDSPQMVPLDDCTDIDVEGGYAMSASIDPPSCTASEVSPAGQAIPTDPVTICCTTL